MNETLIQINEKLESIGWALTCTNVLILCLNITVFALIRMKANR